MTRRTLARLVAVLAAATVAVVGLAAPAVAHVTISASTTAAGAFAVLTVSVPHGCEGSSTIGVTISIPEEINAVTPTGDALWQVEKETETLDPPVTDSHGNEVTERVSTVSYTTDTPLPDGYRDSFELSVQLPDAEGTTLVFPTIQTCEQGESAWIEVPEDGQSADELELPAPSFTVTAAEMAGHGEEPDASDEPDESDEGTVGVVTGSGTISEPDDSGALSIGALLLGVVGAVLGGTALVLVRRRT